ncbi:MAG: hypothetical protein PQJ60_08910 [Spirochaetales bacterium]|nr:hypothetical protein [Spirochaetales bacterium]
MSRKFLFTLLLGLLTLTVWGQSLQNNEYYREMVRLKALSEAAFDEGDYPEAKRLAEEARGYKELSDQWIETQLAAYRARSSLNALKLRLGEVTRWNGEENFPELYREGKALYDQADGEYFDMKDYPASLESSQKGLEVLADIVYVGQESNLPAYYKVRLLPGNTDCLWNIAGYDFIYGDPLKWEKIYEANKSRLPDKDDPDFILPEILLTIPALAGESRSGTWTK